MANNDDWQTFDNARFVSNTEDGGYEIQTEGGLIQGTIRLNRSYHHLKNQQAIHNPH
ncbi:MAG: hypothetical protein K8S16_04140 [Bacteroidales bacterium]|nr:hypothetical protein [Bacteroidales bacterium]